MRQLPDGKDSTGPYLLAMELFMLRLLASAAAVALLSTGALAADLAELPVQPIEEAV